MAANKATENEYNVDSLRKLKEIDNIRTTVSQFLGDSTGEGGLTTALREVIDNAQDEYMNGHGKKIVITFFSDGSAEVQDSGRGIPTGIHKETGQNGIVFSFVNIAAGGKFGTSDSSGGYESGAGGLHGVGTTATNAVSKRFDVTVYRENKEHKISFQRGIPGFFAKENDPESKFTPNPDLKIITDPRSAKDKKERPTGTTIRIWPDEDIFDDGAVFDVEMIRFRVQSNVFLMENLVIEFNDLRDESKPVREVFDFEGGLPEMIETFATDQPLHKPISIRTEGSFKEKANVINEQGKSVSAIVDRKVKIDVALRYGAGFDGTVIKSYVNNINTIRGGTHEAGFYRAMSKVFVDAVKNTPRILTAKEKSNGDIPNIDDVKESLTAIISITVPKPKFDGQAKAELKTSQITSVVSAAVSEELAKFVANKKNAAVVKVALTKIAENARARMATKTLKDNARKKSALVSSIMPPKLVEAEHVGPGSNSELHIVEGDSAAGQMKLSRSSSHQALLPIRGKILNTHDATVSAILANTECAALIQVIGAGMGKDFNVDAMRYDRIIITADADVDGSHIRTLLITLFARLMKPMIVAGRLYAAVPPLYVVKTLGKNAETIYVQNDIELAKILQKLEREKKQVRMPIGRFKGLGEMGADELWDTTLDPARRVLRRITLNDVAAGEKILELAMGDKVDPRKEWIIQNRSLLNPESIDS